MNTYDVGDIVNAIGKAVTKEFNSRKYKNLGTCKEFIMRDVMYVNQPCGNRE